MTTSHMTSARPKISPPKNPPACSKCQRYGISGTPNKSNRCGDKEPSLMKLTLKLLTTLLIAPLDSFLR